jgi:GNAT superfamily N-acetyltransferase
MGGIRRIDEECAELKRLRVAQELQGRGIGEALARALDARARELGYRRLRLDTSEKQLPAQRLFAKLGFGETHRKPVRGLTFIFYEKELVPAS